MSQWDTQAAQMTAEHALWAVNLKIFLAAIIYRPRRLKALRDHRDIIQRRQSRLGKRTTKREAPDAPRLLEAEP